MQFQANYVGQLFYQLDCLAGQPNCSRAQYLAQWQVLGFEATDASQISSWQTLKARYDLSRPLTHQLTGLAEPLVFQSSNGWEQIRAKALEAESLEQFDLALNGLVTAEDQLALLGVLRFFSDKFMARWWQQTGQAQAVTLLKAYQEVAEQAQLGKLIAEVNHFYEGQSNPLGQLRFHLMLQAPGAEDLSLAEQILNHGVIEVSPSQAPHSQLDVMVHEMTHFLFKQLPPETQARIQSYFARQSEPEAMSAYHLLDESLATAIGNGQVNQRLLNPSFFANMLTLEQSFFADPYIDSNAKAQFQAGSVQQSISKGQTLSSEAFLNRYYQTSLAALKLNQPIPSLRLSAVYLADSGLKAALPELQATLKPWSQFVISGGSSGPGFFERYRRLNGVLWFSNDLSGLQAWRSLLGEDAYQALLQANAPTFVYGIQTPLRQIYVLRSGTSEQHSAVIKLLLSQPQNFTGFKFIP